MVLVLIPRITPQRRARGPPNIHPVQRARHRHQHLHHRDVLARARSGAAREGVEAVAHARDLFPRHARLLVDDPPLGPEPRGLREDVRVALAGAARDADDGAGGVEVAADDLPAGPHLARHLAQQHGAHAQGLLDEGAEVLAGHQLRAGDDLVRRGKGAADLARELAVAVGVAGEVEEQRRQDDGGGVGAGDDEHVGLAQQADAVVGGEARARVFGFAEEVEEVLPTLLLGLGFLGFVEGDAVLDARAHEVEVGDYGGWGEAVDHVVEAAGLEPEEEVEEGGAGDLGGVSCFDSTAYLGI